MKLPVENKFDKEEFLSSIRDEVSAGVVAGINEALKDKVVENEKEEIEDEEDKVEVKNTDDKVEVVDEDKKIDKKQTTKLDDVNITQPNESTNFYKLSGRDEFGCKIRK